MTEHEEQLKQDHQSDSAKKQAIQTAQSEAKQKQQAKQKADQKVKDAQTAVTKTEQIIADLEKQMNTNNAIVIPAGYTNALFDGDHDAQLAKLGKQGMQNTFKSSKKDQDIQIDVHHLSQTQKQELAQFVAGLLNPIRQQMGNTLLTPNKDAIKFADEVAKGYDADNWSIYEQADHDVKAITKVAAKYGFDDGGNYYEDWTASRPWNLGTMDGLKSEIYTELVDMLFNDADSGWFHANSLVGYNSGLDYSDDPAHEKEYFGFAVDGMKQFHFISLRDWLQTDQSKFDANANLTVPENDASATQQKITQAKQSLTKQKQTLTSEQQAATQAQQAVAAAQAKLQHAQAPLNNSEQQIAKDQAALKTAQAAVVKAQNKLAATQTKLADLKAQLAQSKQTAQEQATAKKAVKAQLKKDQAALATQKETATQKQQTLLSEQRKLTMQQVSVAVAQNNLELANAQVAGHEQTLASYVNAETNLQQANQQLTAAQAKLKQAQQEYDAAQLAFEQAKAQFEKVQSQAGHSLADVEQAANKLMQAQADLQVALAKLQSQEGGDPLNSTAIPNTVVIGHGATEQHEVVLPTVNKDRGQGTPAKKTQTVNVGNGQAQQTKQGTQAVAKQGELPATGVEKAQKGTFLGMILLGLSSILGLFGLRKKQIEVK